MKLEGIIYYGDNLYWMSRLPDEFVDLCYIRKPQICEEINPNTHNHIQTTSGEE